MDVIIAHSYYNLMSLSRKVINRQFFIASTTILFISLYSMWASCDRQSSVYLSDKIFSKLSFDMTCSASPTRDHSFFSKCHPYYPDAKSNIRSDSDTLSTSTVLYDILESGFRGEASSSDRINSKSLARLLGSVMMNGLPLMGLDDYLRTSDYVNQNINTVMFDAIMNSPFLKGQYGTLLQARNMQIRVSPHNCWTKGFVKHMRKTSALFKTLDVRIFKTMYKATNSKHCCDRVWAVIEIVSKNNICPLDSEWNASSPEYIPHVTLRFHPASIPDSRNVLWSPRKQGGRISRVQAGQLLYFTSGFLTMQLEVQNYLSSLGIGGTAMATDVFSSSRMSLAGIPLAESNDNSHLPLAQFIAEGIISSSSTSEMYTSLFNSTSKMSAPRPVLRVPVYDRAYPTRGYEMDKFWHKLAVMVSIMLIVYFSLPAALIAGYFCREVSGGLLDSLFSIPGVDIRLCTAAWTLSCSLLMLMPCGATFIFFVLVLDHTEAYIPSLSCYLMGLCMGPIVIIISTAVKRAEAAVIMVPTIVFLTMLPGMLYYDLAFDMQRSVAIEVLLCLLPPSAAVMIVRSLCTMEALHSPLTWSTSAVVSDTPLHMYCSMLVFDFFLYFLLAEVYTWVEFRPQRRCYIGSTLAASGSSMTRSNGNRRGNSYGQFFGALPGLGIPGYFLAATSPHDRDNEIELTSFSGRGEGMTIDEVEVGLRVSALSKSFEVFDGTQVDVLADINADLAVGSITSLLGSNGAGKTTFMRILGGFDTNYTGEVQYAKPLLSTYNRRLHRQRIIGWCAQTDSLYDFLTVREHIELYLRLLGLKSSDSPLPPNDSDDGSTDVNTILANLDLKEHANKYACSLSGGMKRRLSLAIACLGNPRVLLLDEPTSGCDAWTRELVRKDILARKGKCAILISTHHVDDVEIISDRVWFLNERSLIFNGELSDLHAGRRDGNGAVVASQDMTNAMPSVLEFATSNTQVRDLFKEWFPQEQTQSGGRIVDAGSMYSCQVSTDNDDAGLRLHNFVNMLEEREFHDWSLVSPNAYRALSSMYDITENKYEENAARQANSDTVAEPSLLASYMNVGIAAARSVFSQMHLLLGLRVTEIRSMFTLYLLSHMLMPFMIILILVFACGDVVFPKLELASASISGVGEVLVGYGANVNSSFGSTLSSHATNHVAVPLSARPKTHHEVYKEKVALNAFMGNHLTWVGDKSSDQLFEELYQEYFAHPDRPRWASFIIDDTVEKWLQSTVRIKDSALRMPADEVYNGLQAMQRIICNRNFSWSNSTLNAFEHSVSNAAFDLWGVRLRHSHDLSAIANDTNRIQFCDHLSSVEISLVNNGNNSAAANTSRVGEDILITTFQALHSNLTMMTNVTTDHGAPIFLKEIAPYLYGSRLCGADKNASSYSLLTAQEAYHLYSHPFDDLNTSSPMYMQRGYLGALMTILYILMTSTVVVKFITYSKASGIKTQLHLCGVSVAVYWISQFIVDTMLLCIPLLSIYLAIWIGGAPIREFFFSSEPFPELVFLIVLFSYSAASVSSNFAFAVVSTDQISSQLISLVTTICGGLFMKLFLIMQANRAPYAQIATVLTWISPSYALSSCLFEMFARYVSRVGKSVGLLGGVNSVWSAQYIPVVALMTQSVFYIILTIVLDIYWYRMKVTCHRFGCSCESSFTWCLRKSGSHLPDVSTASLRSIMDHYIGMASRRTSQSLEETVGLLSTPSKTSRPTAEYGTVDIGEDTVDEETGTSYIGRENSELDHCGTSFSSMVAEHVVEFGMFPVLEPWMVPRQHCLPEPDLLQSRHLSVRYGSCSASILRDLDISIRPGERIALMGVNGGGKSTLFKTLSTADMLPSEGNVSVCDLDTVRDHWAIASSGAVGYVPQEGGLLEFMTVQEAVDLFSGLRIGRHIKPLAHETADEYAEFYSILPKRYFSYTIKSLSGGNKRKLAVVLSNINSPAMLLLDEPSSGVDPAAAERIVQYLCDLPPSQGLLFASHRLDECLRVCQRVLMLLRGSKQFDGPMTALDSVSDLFYQVDVSLVPSSSGRHGDDNKVAMRNFLASFARHLGPDVSLERSVVYSSTLVRLTFEKLEVPYSVTWTVLSLLTVDRIVEKYAFRRMDMEEIFSIMVSSCKNKSANSST